LVRFGVLVPHDAGWWQKGLAALIFDSQGYTE